jgi:UDP-N-acetylglucosamine 1-carboxyvinyltransferase
MAATLLTAEPCVIRRVPNLSDVRFMSQILEWLGAKVELKGDTVRVQAKKVKGHADYDLVRKMRGSICIMGPLLGRLRKATVSLPGGCVIGARPINLHLKAFQALGAKIRIESGYVEASAKRLVGGPMFLGGRAGSTVLGTANAMMAAVLAEGVTIIESAACEPEVVDVATSSSRWAKIQGAAARRSPSPAEGVAWRGTSCHPDRIGAATFADRRSDDEREVTIKGARADHLHAVIDKPQRLVVVDHRGGHDQRRGRKLKPSDDQFRTLVFRRTQVQMMALMTLAPASASSPNGF